MQNFKLHLPMVSKMKSGGVADLRPIWAVSLAVYDQWVLLSLSGIDSLITTPSKIIDPNNDAPAKYKQKPTFGEKKSFFHVSC